MVIDMVEDAAATLAAVVVVVVAAEETSTVAKVSGMNTRRTGENQCELEKRLGHDVPCFSLLRAGCGSGW